MTTPDEVANPLLAQLQMIHGMLRRDLRACLALAEATRAGASTAHVREELEAALGPVFLTWDEWPYP